MINILSFAHVSQLTQCVFTLNIDPTVCFPVTLLSGGGIHPSTIPGCRLRPLATSRGDARHHMHRRAIHGKCGRAGLVMGGIGSGLESGSHKSIPIPIHTCLYLSLLSPYQVSNEYLLSSYELLLLTCWILI